MAEAYVRSDVAALFERWTPFDDGLEGVVYRAVEGRVTKRVELGGRAFFVKQHEGIGLGEVLKSWMSLKRPVYGARNEFEACRYLERMGITAPRVAAYFESEGIAPYRRSLVVCDALEGYENLETVMLRWLDAPPDALEARRLLIQVAEFAAAFHGVGLVHRDFYLCHLLRSTRDPRAPLGVLDLHRALRFDRVPDRWRCRDLAALLFSSLDLRLSPRAWLRFVRIYGGRPLREEFAERGRFWRSVYRRALALYRKGQRKGLVQGRFLR